jgi:hypothetical protein
MRFSEWLLLEKFMNDRSAYCGHCETPLRAVGIVNNNKHIYERGQMRECNCGKSKIWTNSIRDLKALIDYFKGNSKSYYQGFCNDKFCGYCFSSIYPLENGVHMPFPHPNRVDLYGCLKCKDNQNILMDTFLEGKEKETEPILLWYKEQYGF